ncbi:unnamed protein product [Aphis gossypii]|uniref:Uncharacterized protein n=1 Tax=Aphis gossypii TaxID=80765 RepID=A0A9P0J8E9_APHGO|nr:unnamed protein product [Aphis gossypii]
MAAAVSDEFLPHERPEEMTTTSPLVGLASGCAGAVALVYVGQPLDTVKVRMQLSTATQAVTSGGGGGVSMWGCVRDMWRQALVTPAPHHRPLTTNGAAAGAVVEACPVDGHRPVDQQSGRRRTDGPAHVRRHGARAVGQRGRKRCAVRGVRPVPAVGGVRDGPVRRRRRHRHRRGGRGEKTRPRRHGHGRQLGVAVLGVRAVSHRTDQGPSAGGRSGQGQLRFRRRVVGRTSAPRRRRPASGGPGVDHRGRSPGHVSRTGLDGGPRDARLLRVLPGVRGEPHVPDRLALQYVGLVDAHRRAVG